MDDGTEFIREIQNRQSAMIGFIEEIAYIHKFIGKDEIKVATEKYGKSKYSEYLSNLI
jgi:glucose-1-phosphate thymidylyltransferase